MRRDGARFSIEREAEDVRTALLPLPSPLYRPPMPDQPDLRPGTHDELTQSLSFALRFNGRKRTHDADEAMAQITAGRLVEHLERRDTWSCTSRRWASMGHQGTWLGGLRTP
jgi:hypothetical protein